MVFMGDFDGKIILDVQPPYKLQYTRFPMLLCDFSNNFFYSESTKSPAMTLTPSEQLTDFGDLSC